MNPTTDPRFWDAIAERAMSDPDLIGTDVGQKAVERAAAIRSDTRKAEGEDCTTCKGPDGKMRVFQNGQFLRSEYLGTDPTKAFTVDESGSCAEQASARLRTEPREGGASNVTAVAVTWHRARLRRGKWTKGLLDTSAGADEGGTHRWEYKSEWSTYAKQGEIRIPAFQGKAWRETDAGQTTGTCFVYVWRASALDNMNRTIKDLTGSAMGCRGSHSNHVDASESG